MFRLAAPDAASVMLNGDFLEAPPAVQGAPPPAVSRNMNKGDDGVWSITVGPLHPAVYNYSFIVNGVRNIDPSNPMVKRGDRSKDFFADPAAANKKLKLFYIACGKADGLFAESQTLNDALEKHQINHRFAPSEEGHVWRNWRNYLADFAPQLFR